MLLFLTAGMLIALGFASAVSPAMPDLRVGDYWEYSYNASGWQGMSVDANGTVRMEIAAVETRFVDCHEEEVFVVDITGDGQLQGTYEGIAFTGTTTTTGMDTRLVSNFSLVAKDIQVNSVVHTSFGSMKMASGEHKEASPPLNDYVGDESLDVGMLLVSQSHISGYRWTNKLGTNTTETISEDTTLEIRVLAKDEYVSTPAGSFLCWKINVTESSNGNTTYMTGYYSTEVRNYVKMEGSGLIGMEHTDMVLVSYRCSGDTDPPIAVAGPDQIVGAGESVVLDGSGSHDNSQIVNYTWTFVDGTPKALYGAICNYTFVLPGVYNITLTVTDPAGLTGIDWVTITVVAAPSPPVAVVTVNPPAGDVSTIFEFNASQSSDLEDEPAVLQVRWDWDGDGWWDTDWSTDKVAYHQFSLAGDHVVYLEVRDSSGLTDSASVTVRVEDYVIPEFKLLPPLFLTALLVLLLMTGRRRRSRPPSPGK